MATNGSTINDNKGQCSKIIDNHQSKKYSKDKKDS
jgi:hypothetical protein